MSQLNSRPFLEFIMLKIFRVGLSSPIRTICQTDEEGLKATVKEMLDAQLAYRLLHARGLINFFRRGLDCGALTDDEVLESTGLTADELRSGSFSQIAESRQSSIVGAV